MANDLPQVHEGDLAFAWNIENIAGILRGTRGFPIRLIKQSSASLASLTIANRTAGGPILDLLDHNLVTSVFKVSEGGIQAAKLATFIDFMYQSVAPAAPGAATQTIRMYARAGNLYFKVENSAEQQIPVGLPPGPTIRYTWALMGG